MDENNKGFGPVCDECYILINDLGSIQCRDCGAFFTKTAIIRHLKLRYGDSWKPEYVKLRKNRGKGLRGNFRDITTFQIADNGNLHTKKFYE